MIDNLQLIADDIETVRQYLISADSHVVDSNGERWLFCRLCGKIAISGCFHSYGGSGLFMNSGVCEDCYHEKWR